MSQPNQPAQPTQSPPPSGSRRGFSRAVGIGLIIIALLGLGAAGYTMTNPHVTTVTQQQLITNTQSLTNTQTQTVTSLGTQTVTNVVTTTNAMTSAGYTYGVSTVSSGYYSQSNQNCNYNGCYYNPGYQSCSYNGCYYNGLPGYNNYYYTNVCQSVGGNNMVQCSGYLYHDQSGCVVLSIPIDNGYWFETRVYQYYTLQNLPANYQNIGGWVTVMGQMNQGYNASPTGAACPGNYIIVSSISA